MKKYFFCLFVLSLGGCGSLLTEKVVCPKTAIIAQFSKTVDFHKNNPIRTEMDSLQPLCQQDGNQISIEMRLRVTSLRPPFSFHPPAKIKPSYFVAVVDEAGNVLSRTDHEIEVTLEENQTSKISFEYIHEKVPVGKEVTVYVGFNVDEAQFDFIQKEREKKMQKETPLK